MANFKNLAMSEELMSLPQLSIRKGFLGLTSSLVYNPTDSPLRIVRQNYSPEAQPKLANVLEATTIQSLTSALKSLNIKPQPIGTIELQACVSRDGNFVAAQLLQFIDYLYKPVTKLAIFEGEQAQIVSQLF